MPLLYKAPDKKAKKHNAVNDTMSLSFFIKGFL